MEEQPFNHQKASIQDMIALTGELEHLRYHCIRSAYSAKDQKEKFVHQVHAKQCQDLRREAMAKFFPNLSELMWCQIKSVSRLRQLAYELFEGDMEYLTKIENITDNIISKALNADVSSCEACRTELESIQKETSEEVS